MSDNKSPRERAMAAFADLAADELKRILQDARRSNSSVPVEIFEQARTAGLIDENDRETF